MIEKATVRRYQDELQALTAVAKVLTSPLDLKDLLVEVMTSFSSILASVDAGAVMLWDASSGLFRAEAIFGYDSEVMKDIGLRAGESITGKVFDSGEICLLGSSEQVLEAMDNLRPANRDVIARALGTKNLPRSAVAAPIRVGEHRLGVLVLESMEGPVDFNREDLPFISTIADVIALAIDRARLELKAEQTWEAEQIDRLRSEIMATLSHELRTPIAAIKGYSTALLLDEIEWDQEKRREFLELIDDECDNLKTMVSDILDSSLIDVGQLMLHPEPIRLPILVGEIAEEMQFHTATHQLLVDLPEEFPIIDADPRRITQVIRNILDNAIKYSPDGGLVVIKASVREKDVVINVSDQGVGISPEDLIPLFEKYFRVKAPAGYHVAGTGLGLPIAQAIVDAHGGRIWAESEVGEGTTISFSLPREGLSASHLVSAEAE